MDKRANIQGFYVDLLTFDEVINKISNSNINQNIHIVTINPEIIQNAKKTSKLKEIINGAEIITPDGIGIKLALKFKGIRQEQVTGVDLSRKIIELAAMNGDKIAFIGAKENVLTLMISNLKALYPELDIVYSHDGYFEDFTPIINDVVNSGAKYILCALGSPKQDYFIAELKKHTQNACMIGVGGVFDVLSGTVMEAPVLYKKIGLEWLYRTVKQPERFKRIFPALPIFFFQSIIDSISSKN